ncbi:MAG: TIGR00282 family metallophosphoesterase [Hyphomicrobiales bacterium]|nr:TIGR00282 family metallophosphoesterase [Hyphomicrobiales bacterium]
MRLLFIGDVMGRSGRNAVIQRLPELRTRFSLDCVIVNGENAAGGAGITETICNELIEAGADAVTLGNHSWDQREALVFIERQPRLLRPANWPSGTPGRGAAIVETKAGARILVVNLIGRVFMGLADDPFAAAEREVTACPLGAGCDAAVIDMHAEATSEKQAMGHFLDGRASLVVGTHTHAPTSDERILPGGTGFQTDCGMTGDYDSIIGVEKGEPLRRFLQPTPASRFEAASGEATLCGLAVETDPKSGLATKVAALRLGGSLKQAEPDFW